MKSIKYAALSIALTLGVFYAVLYSSCSKDTCKAVTCINGGNCSGGACICPTGLGGSNCQVVYRNLYTNLYSGNAAYSSSVIDSNYIPHIDTNSVLIFTAGNDSNFNNMKVAWNRASGKQVPMNITLSNNSTSGSDFSVSATTVDTFTYTGSGTVNANAASLNLIETHPNSHSVVITLSNFVRQ